MTNTILFKRNNTSGTIPTVSSLELGEIAINTYDGKLFTKINDGSESIVEVGSVQELIANGQANVTVQDDGSITFTLENFSNAISVSGNGNVTANGNITASYFLGNGSLLEGVSSNSITQGDTILIVNQDETITYSASGFSNAISISGNGDITSNGTITGNDFRVLGNLLVQGATVTLNTTELTVEDLNIILANTATTPAEADGAGFTINGANVGITYVSSTNTLQTTANASVDENLSVTGNISAGNLTVTGATDSNDNSTGAIIVTGGVGVSGNINANNMFINGNTVLTANATIDGGEY